MFRRCSERPRARRVVAWLLALVVLGCTTPLSMEDERRVAIEADRDVRRQMPMLRDEVVLAYVDRIGQDVVRALGPQPYEYRFHVISDPEINAFTPGAGFVYVHSALILAARNVSELAGVLAHEIGHVERRHVANAYNRQRSASVLHTIGVIAGGVLAGQAGAAAADIGGGLAAGAVLAAYTREQETEADEFALPTLIRAGYDPHGLVTMFETLRAQYGDGGIPFLQSHPAPSQRIATTRAALARTSVPEGLRVDDGGQLEIIQRRVRLLEKTDRPARRRSQ